MRYPVRLLTVLTLLGGTLAPLPGSACGNSYYHEVDPRVRQLQAAELSVGANALDRAARLALELFPRTRQLASASDTLELRARRILALVCVRTGGRWIANGALADPGPDQRKAHLDWSTAVLRQRLAGAGGAPDAAVELAEALALRDSTQAEAMTTLEALATKDMIANPYAWVTLARLREARGDAAGRDRALAKCRPLANDKSVCAISAAPAAKSKA